MRYGHIKDTTVRPSNAGGGGLRLRRRRYVAALLLVCFTGCTLPHPGTSLLPPQPASTHVGGVAWIADVEVTDPELTRTGTIQETLFLSVKDYTQEAGYFDQVKTLPGKPTPGDYMLYFDFDHFRYSKRIYPLYFPAAFLTLTMYIWFGGPITIEEYNISGTLTVKSPTGEVLAKSEASIKDDDWHSLYSERHLEQDIPKERTAVVRELLDNVAMELQQRRAGR